MVVSGCFPATEYFPWCVGQTGSRIISSPQSAFAGLAVLSNMPVLWTTSWEEAPSPVPMRDLKLLSHGLGLLRLCWYSSCSPPRGSSPRLCLLFFPYAIQIFIVGELGLIQNGMDRRSPWLLASLIFITVPLRCKDFNWDRLHQVAEQKSWYQHRNFY